MHFTMKQRISAKNAIQKYTTETSDTNRTLPLPNCCPHLPALWHFKNQNTIIWQFNRPHHFRHGNAHRSSNILSWIGFGKTITDLGMNWMAKPIAWSAMQRYFQSKCCPERNPVRGLSAQRQSYLGETTGQMDQHEHCPWCLQGNQTKLGSSKRGVKSEYIML